MCVCVCVCACVRACVCVCVCVVPYPYTASLGGLLPLCKAQNLSLNLLPQKDPQLWLIKTRSPGSALLLATSLKELNPMLDTLGSVLSPKYEAPSWDAPRNLALGAGLSWPLQLCQPPEGILDTPVHLNWFYASTFAQLNLATGSFGPQDSFSHQEYSHTG